MNRFIGRLGLIAAGAAMALGGAVALASKDAVAVKADASWEKASSIAAGDTVILVCEGQKKELTGISTTKTKYGIGTEYTTTPAGTYQFSVVAGYNNSGLAFKNGDNYLYWTIDNSLNVNSTLSANTSWTVTFNSSNNALFKNNGNSTREIWFNTSSPRFACYTGKSESTSGYAPIQVYKLAQSNELSSVSTSGQTTSFTAGNKWSYGGTLTASYTIEDDATVTPTYFKYGASGINPTSAGEDIDTDTVLTHDDHNGKYIYVVYTEDDVTKWASYQITVNYKAVTSVSIDIHAAEIGVGKTYAVSNVAVTVEDEYANPETAWKIQDRDGASDATFSNGVLTAGSNTGSVTLRCYSTADENKYDDLVVTISGDPVADITPSSASGFVGKEIDVEFTYGNMDDETLISFASTNEDVFAVKEFIVENGEGIVTLTAKGEGDASLSVSYNGGSTLDSITVSVEEDYVTALTWSAPTIKVYSGASTTVADAASWNVHYTMASEDEGDLAYGDYTLKLGGTAITLPHVWSADDDGKALSIEYDGFASPTTATVDVTQRLQSIKIDVEKNNSTLTFAKACGGSGTSDGGEAWTVTSDGTESNFDNTKGIHYGTGSAAVQYIKLTSFDFNKGTITKVVVNASTASEATATVGVKVGGAQFGGNPQSLTSSAANYTFTGSDAADEIEVEITKPSSATKALYCKSIAVTYETPSGEQTELANVASHEAAQKAVVTFAKAFNAAMDETEYCTTNMDTAWATASAAYVTFKTAISALSEDEQAYAYSLLANCTGKYTDNTDDNYEYCLERAMKTYDVCVSKHGKTAFMVDGDENPLRAKVDTPATSSIIPVESNAALTIALISAGALAAAGTYFFLRKRKEQ